MVASSSTTAASLLRLRLAGRFAACETIVRELEDPWLEELWFSNIVIKRRLAASATFVALIASVALAVSAATLAASAMTFVSALDLASSALVVASSAMDWASKELPKSSVSY